MPSKKCSCTICDYSSEYPWNLKRHMKTHENQSDANNNNCRFCLKYFERGYNLRRHEDSCACRNAVEDQNVATEAQNVAQEVLNVPTDNDVDNVQVETKEACIFCYKEFKNQKTLKRHIPRCSGITHPYMCPKCKQVFADRKTKSKHLQRCKGGNANNSLILYDDTANQPNTITPITNNVQANEVTMNQIGTQQNIQQNIQQQNIVQINCFGKEDLDGLLDSDYLDARLRELNGKGIYRIVKDAHFDKSRPQNHNIRMGSKKRKMLKVKNVHGWEMRANCDIMETLIGNYKRILTIRSFEPDFRKKYESDFMQIHQDLLKFDQKMNASAYYGCCHKILALIENMENDHNEVAIV